MPVPLLFALPPLITWAAGGAVATGAVVGAAALDRRAHSRSTSTTASSAPHQNADVANNGDTAAARPPPTITEDHTPAIRALEAALVKFVNALQNLQQARISTCPSTSSLDIAHDTEPIHSTTARRTSANTSPTTAASNTDATHHPSRITGTTRPRAQSTTLPPSPLDPLLIWTRRILARLTEIRIGRDAEGVAQSIRERLDELVRRMVMAQALFQGEEWRAVKGVFLAVDEVGRVLGRRVVGVVEGMGVLGEGGGDGDGQVPMFSAAAGGAIESANSHELQDDDGDDGGGVVLGGAGANVDLATVT